MGLEDSDFLDDADGGGKAAVSVSCSICLELVTDNGDRAWAKLQCGHQFHLDCIGSAFNVKGVMQCPNCRKIEKGQWLYANGCRPYPEFNMDDWAHDEDLYDLSYSEMSFGVHWCPFSGLTRFPSSFEEGEFPTTAYHDLLGQHAIFAEHAAVSSASHPCPYIAYIGPVHPSSSSSNATGADGPNYNNQWNSQSTSSEIPNSYTFPTMDVHYHTLFPSSSRVGGVDQPYIPPRRTARPNADIPRSGSHLPYIPPRRPDRPNADIPRSGSHLPYIPPRRPDRPNADIPRSGSYLHPFLVGQSSAGRAPSSVGSSMMHPYPGSVARQRDRAQALQAYFQQPSNLPSVQASLVSGAQRSSTQVQVGPVASSSDQTHGGLYFLPTSSGSSTSARNFQEAEISMSNPFHHTWEREPHLSSFDRDPGWAPFHQTGSGSDNGLRPTTNFRLRHGDTERQNLYRS